MEGMIEFSKLTLAEKRNVEILCSGISRAGLTIESWKRLTELVLLHPMNWPLLPQMGKTDPEEWTNCSRCDHTADFHSQDVNQGFDPSFLGLCAECDCLKYEYEEPEKGNPYRCKYCTHLTCDHHHACMVPDCTCKGYMGDPVLK